MKKNKYFGYDFMKHIQAMLGLSLVVGFVGACESPTLLNRANGVLAAVNYPFPDDSDFRCLEQGQGGECVLFTHSILDADIYEVTQDEWVRHIAPLRIEDGEAVYAHDKNPSFNQAEHCFVDGKNQCPVERVSYFEVLYYANRLSELYGLSPCYNLFNCRNEESIGSGCPEDLEGEKAQECEPCSLNEFGVIDCPDTEYFCAREGAVGALLQQIPEALPGCTGFQVPTYDDVQFQMAQYREFEDPETTAQFREDITVSNGWCALRFGPEPDEFESRVTQPVGTYQNDRMQNYFKLPLEDLSGNVSEWTNFEVFNGTKLTIAGANISTHSIVPDEGGRYYHQIEEFLPTNQCHHFVSDGPRLPTEKAFDVGFRLIRKLFCQFDVPYSEFLANQNDQVYIREHCEPIPGGAPE